MQKGDPLFPRIDLAKELEELEKITKTHASDATKGGQDGAKKAAEKPEIGIEEFDKIQLKTAKVLAAENIQKSKKLLKLTVQMGDEVRTIVSGIRGAYEAEDMVGKSVVVVANLKPAKLCGVLSQGMILAVGEGSELALLTADKPMPDGLEIG